MSSSYDKLNKLNSGNYKYQNKFVEDFFKKAESKETKSDPTAGIKRLAEKKDIKVFEKQEKGIIEYDGHLRGYISTLQNEINNLKFDILTLSNIINQNNKNMTIDVARKEFSLFRANDKHILNKIVNKIEIINENKLNLND